VNEKPGFGRAFFCLSFERRRQINARASRFACPIAAVYPIDREG
jgi:hypothetical protein